MASWKIEGINKGLEKNEYLLVAVKTIQYLGWELRFISDHGLIAGVPGKRDKNIMEEGVTIWFKGEQANIESRSNGFEISNRKNKYNVEQYLSLFEEMQYRINGEEQLALRQWLLENKSSGREDVLDPASKEYRQPGKMRAWYQPPKESLMTTILIATCVMVFILMVAMGAGFMSPSVESLINWGANVRQLTAGEGEWWRLISCIFLHVGVLHLLMNMVGLYMIGIILEPKLGKWRLLAAFLVTGAGGSIASIFWNPAVASAGASGAIFGLFGLLLALLTTNLIQKSIRKAILPNLLSVIGLNLLIGFAPGIDYAAHIGGLLTGLVLGYIYFLFFRNRNGVWLSILAAVLLGGGIAAVGLKYMQDDGSAFRKIMGNALVYEEEAVRVSNISDSSKSIDHIAYVQNKILPAWKKFQDEIVKLDQLKLSPDLQSKRELLKKYAMLRTRYFETMIQNEKINADPERTEAERLNILSGIDSVLNELNGPN
ncbi:MAG: rhomboid family intramembrane serine protease [Pseudobacter sp.]|uniref:rhomboid family intramembrane serine protease n=1 Tax=Pseudobacter sp. TaxID=2045420 RepID=UPI003F8225A1